MTIDVFENIKCNVSGVSMTECLDFLGCVHKCFQCFLDNLKFAVFFSPSMFLWDCTCRLRDHPIPPKFGGDALWVNAVLLRYENGFRAPVCFVLICFEHVLVCYVC